MSKSKKIDTGKTNQKKPKQQKATAPKLRPEDFPRMAEKVFQFLCAHDRHGYCIESGAFLTRLLHRLGYPKAYRLTVGVAIENPAFRRWIATNGRPMDEASAAACEAAGGIEILLGKGTEGIVPADRWPGHLVIVVPNVFDDGRHAIFDLTIVQINSQAPDIRVPPLCFKANDDFVLGRHPFGLVKNETQLVYLAHPDDQSFNEPFDRMKMVDLDQAVSDVLKQL